MRVGPSDARGVAGLDASTWPPSQTLGGTVCDAATPCVTRGPSASPAAPEGTREDARMRYVILACVVALAGSLDLVVLIAASDDSLAAFELHHPALLLPI